MLGSFQRNANIILVRLRNTPEIVIAKAYVANTAAYMMETNSENVSSRQRMDSALLRRLCFIDYGVPENSACRTACACMCSTISSSSAKGGGEVLVGLVALSETRQFHIPCCSQGWRGSRGSRELFGLQPTPRLEICNEIEYAMKEAKGVNVGYTSSALLIHCLIGHITIAIARSFVTMKGQRGLGGGGFMQSPVQISFPLW
jgi:hypothetical protein